MALKKQMEKSCFKALLNMKFNMACGILIQVLLAIWLVKKASSMSLMSLTKVK